MWQVRHQTKQALSSTKQSLSLSFHYFLTDEMSNDTIPSLSTKNKSTRTPQVITLQDYIHSKLGASFLPCTKIHNQWNTKIQLSSYRHIWQRTHKDYRTAISRPQKLVRPCFGENIREKPIRWRERWRLNRFRWWHARAIMYSLLKRRDLPAIRSLTTRTNTDLSKALLVEDWPTQATLCSFILL